MTANEPVLIIVAGSNGSGKSTYTRYTQQTLGVPVIDPDSEAKSIRPNAPETAAMAGAKQAILRARTYLASDRSFAVETTLSGSSYLRMMRQAKQKGWQIYLIYIGINDVDIAIKRVSQRVAAGGHSVPELDVRRRYMRSMANLTKAIRIADRTAIYDNSTKVGYQPILAIEAGKITKFVSKLPEWIESSLPPEYII